MNDEDLQNQILGIFRHDADPGDVEWYDVRTFEEDGVLTYNKGLVFKMQDGTQFQVSIVQSR